ncbi:MAG: hypothetical protein H6767_06095 [Candidatus Peribacteria bacterium]|nr:MAG: hypothetical protein H6767_06095 [Candidatus Peribacteria bacterium]
MNRWVNYLFQACPYDSEKVTVYVIPCLNLDGYEEAKKQRDYFHGGRKGKTNARNVDLNRNFPTYNWSKKSKLFVAGKRYEVSGGQKPASEPEISSLIDFIEKKEISRIYTFHSRWETVFSLNADKRVRRYSDLSGYRIFLMGHWHELSPEQKTGHSMIWGKEQERKIIEVELATRWSSEWKKNKLALIDSVSL